MKYAVIADIHGNLHGLNAVLRDAQEHGAEKTLFLGDYIGDFPFVNECVDRVRETPGAVSVRGNKEDYFHEIRKVGLGLCASEQYAPIAYSMKALRPDNLAWLDALPKEARISDQDNGTMTLAHRLSDLIGGLNWGLSSSNYARQQDKEPVSHAEYLAYAQKLADSEEKLLAMPDGVYLFGDSHMQWHARHAGVLLINPGSCGLPLDGSPQAKYTLLESRGGDWHVTERQIDYDIEAAASAYLASAMFSEAPVWGKLNLYKLRTGIDRLYRYFEEVKKLSGRAGSISEPHSDEAWRKAGEAVLASLGEV